MPPVKTKSLMPDTGHYPSDNADLSDFNTFAEHRGPERFDNIVHVGEAQIPVGSIRCNARLIFFGAASLPKLQRRNFCCRGR